ncbi:ATP-binding cassette domain-containing protein [Alkalibacterium putridalgicola]|jgi:putative ABC transport system ATP-binding protein|uniref:ABC transporter ATP-binding protein n=1 Tax=Alkalibacterium putridalgicola TaxID=426703 RepID=A0A1H7UZL5_9LACT|nr:ATP-binding cassette domain-containing protein [Alkalibacterium putridalgicola]GEK89569.1 ABC transporter ATP-binding protein [Alkalibacterium putridalgicola]SEM01947.1 putative ABC transport system ATP-binding protein [Alkalibacterium putridalgicola]
MTDNIIEVNNISFNVGHEKILSGVDFSIVKGERVTITGPSGGGKSTLLKIIASILTPTKGNIVYKGKDVSEIDPIDYRKEVSYFFQNATLFDQTVRDNLAFPYEIRDEEFNETKSVTMLERLKLNRSYLDKEVKDLSGGEKQRVALVRNLLYKPEVILLDEVTSSLDAENKDIIYSILDELNEEDNMTILSVTHDEREINKADRIIRILDGKVAEQ